MKAAAILATGVVLLAGCLAAAPAIPARDALYVSNYENVLGTSLQLKVLASSEARSKQAEAAAIAEIDRDNGILSSYDPDSEFSRWFRTQGAPVRVSPELFEVFGLFDLWRSRTDGALDSSAEAITRVWQAAAARQSLPTPADLASAVAAVRRTHWRLDPAARTATHTSETPLAMNSFVKSYIIGRAASAALAVAGVRGIVVNIGGDLAVRGEWSEPVDIADPRSDAENAPPIARLLIRDRAVATSGDYRRGVTIAGRHYSHIVDPRTGQPAERVISSTVIAPSASDAGALATAFSVLSPDESGRLAAALPGVEYLLVTEDGRQIASDSWSSLAMPAAAPPSGASSDAAFDAGASASAARLIEFPAQAAPVPKAPASSGVPGASAPKAAGSGTPAKPGAAPAPLWNRLYQLDIHVEIAHIEGIRIMRPFVAVWIEDPMRIPVRTIALWYGSYRYIPELKVWFRDEQLGLPPGPPYYTSNESRDLNYINSVSSATRPPGAYTLKWDGRADNAKLIKAGPYTVIIEASREHGTYQIIRQEMNFNGKPAQMDLPGNLEIASASLDYHLIKR